LRRRQVRGGRQQRIQQAEIQSMRQAERQVRGESIRSRRQNGGSTWQAAVAGGETAAENGRTNPERRQAGRQSTAERCWQKTAGRQAGNAGGRQAERSNGTAGNAETMIWHPGTHPAGRWQVAGIRNGKTKSRNNKPPTQAPEQRNVPRMALQHLQVRPGRHS